MRIALASGEAASVAPGASVSCIWLSVVPASPSDTFNAQAVEAAARELLDSRVVAARDLAAARRRTADERERIAQLQREQQTALAQLDRDDADAHAKAIQAGWTAEELKRLGFNGAIAKRAARRSSPRRAARGTAAPTAETTAPAVDAGPQD